MAQVMRMPSEKELPPGTLRDFVEMLFVLYREARRPTLREISSAIRNGNYRGTASTETIRKMLRGAVVPRHWATVEAVFLALCDLAGWEPDASLRYEGEGGTVRSHMERRWHRALDEPDLRYGRAAEDPWKADLPDSFGGDRTPDEPPF